MKAPYFLKRLFRHILLPVLIASVCLRFIPFALPRLVRVCIYTLAVPTNFAIGTRQGSHEAKVEAARNGVEEIPPVKGRLPLNLDILYMWIQSGWEEAGWIVKELHEWGQTFNTKVLGENQASHSCPVCWFSIRSWYKGRG